MMDPGVYPGLPMADYLAIDAASNSRLSKLLRSPAHLRAYLEEPAVDTTAFRIGRAVHVAVLEPDYFTERFTVAGQCGATYSSGKNAGRRCVNPGVWEHRTLGWVCGMHARGEGEEDLSLPRAVLTEDEHRGALAIRDSVHAHGAAGAIVRQPGAAELTVVWDDPGTGVRCKGRLDWHKPELAGGTIADVKTTEDASPPAFERSLFKWGYHRQAAYYLMAARALGLDARHYAIIAVEKRPPYAVAVYRLGEDALGSLDPPAPSQNDYATAGQLRALLRLYEQCRNSGDYPGYDETVRDLSVPEWAWKAMEDQTTEVTRRTEGVAA